MNRYTRLDMLRIAQFAKLNANLKPLELLALYDKKHPRLSAKDQLMNVAKVLELPELIDSVENYNEPNNISDS